eukprot:361323-Chlamydomonas_euryale.AAC.19
MVPRACQGEVGRRRLPVGWVVVVARQRRRRWSEVPAAKRSAVEDRRRRGWERSVAPRDWQGSVIPRGKGVGVGGRSPLNGVGEAESPLRPWRSSVTP